MMMMDEKKVHQRISFLKTLPNQNKKNGPSSKAQVWFFKLASILFGNHWHMVGGHPSAGELPATDDDELTPDHQHGRSTLPNADE